MKTRPALRSPHGAIEARVLEQGPALEAWGTSSVGTRKKAIHHEGTVSRSVEGPVLAERGPARGLGTL